MRARPPPRPVWRVSLLWEGTVLDIVTLADSQATLALRTGETVAVRRVMVPAMPGLAARAAADAQAQADDAPAWPATGVGVGVEAVEALEVHGHALLAVMHDGQFCALPAGHVLHVHQAVPATRADDGVNVDATLLHAGMVSFAIQTCLLSALMWAPLPALDPEAGAGIPDDVRRFIALPGGSAPTIGAPSFAPRGRRPDEAERPRVERSRGGHTAQLRPAARARGVEEIIEEMKRALQQGTAGVELKETIGDLARATARSTQLGAQLGGLSLRDTPSTANSSGVVGAGTSRLPELLRKRIQERDREDSRREARPRTEREAPRVSIDLSGAELRLDESALDPVVRDHLSRMIRARHNVVRGCYEAWGLTGERPLQTSARSSANAPDKTDHAHSGRLVLELTLEPDGTVSDVQGRVDNPALQLAANCVLRAARSWYLGDGLVETPTRLAFPFVLRPRDG